MSEEPATIRSWKRWDSAGEFLKQVEPSLSRREAENSLMLGALQALASGAPRTQRMFFGAWQGKGSEPGLVALFFRQNLVLSGDPGDSLETAVGQLAKRLAQDRFALPGVVGLPRVSEAFAKAWRQASGALEVARVNQALHELRALEEPRPAPGSARPVEIRDRELLVEWLDAFSRESLPHEERSLQEAEASAEEKIRTKSAWVWVDDQGTPVATANLARPTRRGVTVNAVYTPPAHRGRGYASNVVAAVTRDTLAQGKEFCVLYTDLANPVSNSIYARLGYRRVADALRIGFRGPGRHL
jgi:predicted GNAT family acetyltransferase